MATKAELIAEQDELVKFETYDLSLFTVQSCYLKFQPICKTITTFSGLLYTASEWESKGLPNEKFTSPYTANKILYPKLLGNNSRLRLRFEGSCLKQEFTAAFTPNNVVNLFITVSQTDCRET